MLRLAAVLVPLFFAVRGSPGKPLPVCSASHDDTRICGVCRWAELSTM